MLKRVSSDKKLHAYIVGLVLGDGNLSNPNGRAVRLRITCDKKYPELHRYILSSLQKFLPDNKVFISYRKNCLDVTCYSNMLEKLLGWKAKGGSKYAQMVEIPKWILRNKIYTKECLRGIIQTDGSIYKDRGYLMVNITSSIPSLAESVVLGIKSIGYKPNIQPHQDPRKIKYTIRISKNTQKFIDDIGVWKR
ncbi:MAG: LAGLIDADG family homing endonuclease [Candidatus Paceibacterota bacterium]|jgi:DNA-binding transcriptional regulator WhiA